MTLNPLELPKPKEPYRGILPFRLLDWRIFFEREAETERLANLVSLYRGVLVYGQSGTGKSSLVNAGLLANAVRKGRAPERIRLYPQKDKELFLEPISLREEEPSSDRPPGSAFLPSRFIDPEHSAQRVQLSCQEFLERLHQSRSDDMGPPLLFFDQFEELVTLFENNPKKAAEIETATGAQAEIQSLILTLLLDTSLAVKVVFAFRDDYLARLTPLFSQIPHLLDQSVRLEQPKVGSLNRIIRGPFRPSIDCGIVRGDFTPELTEEVAGQIEAGIRATQPSGLLNLSEIQTICLALWRQPRLREELLRPGANPGAILSRIIESEALAALNQLQRWDRARAIAVLANLVTEDGTRNVVPHEMLVNQTRRNPLLWLFRGDWQKFLGERLPNTGLVRRSLSSGTHYYYELASESLIPRIQIWQQQLRRRRQIFFAVICVVLVVLMVGLPSYEWYRAKLATAAAQAAESKVVATKQDLDETLFFMQFQVSEAFKSLGQPKMLTEINDHIIAHFEHFPPQAADFDGLRAQALAIQQRADLSVAGGELDGVIDEYKKAVEMFRQLAAQRPKVADYGRDVSNTYIGIGDVLRMQGDLPGALNSYRTSLDVITKLASDARQSSSEGSGAKSGDEEFQRDLSVLYDRIATILIAQGNSQEALKNYRASLNIAETLAAKDIDDEKRRDLLVSRLNVGRILYLGNDFKGALENYSAALAVAKELAAENSVDKTRQRDLASAHRLVAAVLRDQGDIPAAFGHFQASSEIAERLVAHDADDPASQLEQADSYRGLGDIRRDQKAFESAVEYYQKALEVFQRLVQRGQSNVEWKRELTFIYACMGDTLVDARSYDDALRNYRDGLAITKRLMEKTPDDFNCQTDLSDWDADIGKALRGKGDLAGALQNYRDSVAIREKVAPRDPANAMLQADLAWIYWQTAVVSEQLKPASKPEALDMLKKGVDILRQLKEKTGLSVEEEKWFTESQADLARMSK